MTDCSIEFFDGAAPAACLAIRTRVFVEEQGVPVSAEVDGRDPGCVHALARVGREPVGCARMRLLDDGSARIERVAVLPARRQEGFGVRLMAALEAEARARGWRRLQLHAQHTVVRFYEQLAWTPVGEPFEEAGIVHRAMVKTLS